MKIDEGDKRTMAYILRHKNYAPDELPKLEISWCCIVAIEYWGGIIPADMQNAQATFSRLLELNRLENTSTENSTEAKSLVFKVTHGGWKVTTIAEYYTKFEAVKR